MAKFDLAAVMAETMKDIDVSNSDTLELIELSALESDERNFYELSNIDELAANIELVGLQQPIRVRAIPETPGRYRIISGHRRCAALRKLAEDDPEKWGKAACIVERGNVSSAMEELRLIYANKDTRKISDADLAKQAERVTELLYQLKEEGIEFSGRMRDHVAEACSISATKLATLKVIREKLSPQIKHLFEDGTLSTDAAYKLAQLPALQQPFVIAAIPKPTAAEVGNIAKAIENGANYQVCTLKCPGGRTCGHTMAFLRHDAKNPWEQCKNKKCCLKCDASKPEYNACASACSLAKKARKEALDEKKAEHDERAKTYQDEQNAKLKKAAQRLVKAIDAAGISDETELPINYTAFSAKTVREFAAGSFGKIRRNGRDLDVKYTSELSRLMGTLHCSAEYLLGMTDELTPAPKAEAGKPEWQTGAPTRDGCYVIKYYINSKKPTTTVMRWKACAWHYPSSGGILDASCVIGWWPIPEV